MIPTPPRPTLALAMAAALLAGCGAPAGERSPSLYERRLGVIQGQSAGVEVLPARRASEADGAAGLRLPPPTGRPLSESKKTDSPDHGIVLPSAAGGAK
jgi:hypothetical protein